MSDRETHRRAFASPTGAHRALLRFLPLLALHVAALWFLRTGFKGSDDGIFAHIAHSLNTGTYQWAADVFHDRVMAWAPLAVVFRLLGTSPETILVWPILCSVVTLVLVWDLGRRTFGERPALAGAFLFAVSNVQIHYSSVHNAEPIYASLLFASVYSLWHARRAAQPWRGLLLGSLSALLFVGSFLAKLPAVWGLPFFAVLAARDLRHRAATAWIGFAATAAIAGALYLTVYAVGVGDPLARLHALSVYNEAPFSFQGDSTDLLRRIVFGPLPVLATHLGYAFAFAFALVAGIDVVRRREWNHPAGYMAGFLASVLFAHWLGTSSLRAYKPVPLNPKYLLVLLPPLSLWAGEGVMRLAAALRTGAERAAVPAVAVLALAGAAALSLPDDPRMTLLLAAGAIAVAGAWAARSLGRWVPAAGVAAILALASVPLLHRATLSGALEATRAEARVMEVMLRKARDGRSRPLVYTDPRSAQMLPIYFGYAVPEPVRFLAWDRTHWREIPELASTHDELWLYVHRYRMRNMSEIYGVPIPPVAEDPPDDWPVLARTPAVALYRVAPDRSARLVGPAPRP